MDGGTEIDVGLALTDAELDIFAGICAREVAPIHMENLARENRVVDDFETFVKETMAGQADPIKALNRAILAELNRRRILTAIVETMLIQIPWTDGNKRIVAGFAQSVRSSPNPQIALQALLTKRGSFFANNKLGVLYNDIGPRIGILAGTFLDVNGAVASINATVFLVGPDLVLTAKHTFDDVQQLPQVPECFSVAFDHKFGDPIVDHQQLLQRPGLRVVGLHPDWLVTSSPSVRWAGTVANLNPQQIQELLQGLDFALLRLATPVGNLPVQTGARARRGWLKVATPAGPFPFAANTQLAMPQHPGGLPLKHAFGSITGPWDPTTRIIYQLDAARGSSGAPCLNADMDVIGVHSAAYMPGQVVLGNLAVRIDVVCPQVVAHLQNQAPPPPPAATAWRATRVDRSLVPIIGRQKLQVWCDAAMKGATAVASRGRSDRVYAADAQSQRAGKTFTDDILRTLLVGQPGHNIVVIGGKTSAMPETVEEFINVLAAGFGMSAQDLGAMPTRAGATLPQGAKDGDKLDRWLSQELPEWFAGRLAAHRTVETNRSAVARSLVAANEAFGRPNAQEDITLANASPAVTVSEDRWRKTWVLLEDVDRQPPSTEVRRFVAGLIGADVDENAVTGVRSAIQWLFLGRAPDFLLASDMTVETITADIVPVDALETTFAAAFEEAGIEDLDAASVAAAIQLIAPAALQTELVKQNVEQTLLSVCQRLAADLIAGIYAKGGHPL
ncbi:trypsin-like serine peptidase [Mesorhizobium sp. BR1-1-14]|uniref:trypsin-like serine peptidase n=1 Tax=Mesorhizobium sp. BR1-1-14 TaxID=2876655 RepID=UPI001CD06917|nr:trypsin-like peptidase domain-containing protein [Mesorhizobium sp. BR1-1-14]MBZ9959311.1 trypsin-like peptidase domain-containing protein [Mesorhizobium sp. BR1-1-14]